MKNIITKLSDLALMLLAVVIGVGIAMFMIFAPPAALIVAIVCLGIVAVWLHYSCKKESKKFIDENIKRWHQKDLKTFIKENPDFEEPEEYER